MSKGIWYRSFDYLTYLAAVVMVAWAEPHWHWQFGIALFLLVINGTINKNWGANHG